MRIANSESKRGRLTVADGCVLTRYSSLLRSATAYGAERQYSAQRSSVHSCIYMQLYGCSHRVPLPDEQSRLQSAVWCSRDEASTSAPCVVFLEGGILLSGAARRAGTDVSVQLYCIPQAPVLLRRVQLYSYVQRCTCKYAYSIQLYGMSLVT